MELGKLEVRLRNLLLSKLDDEINENDYQEIKTVTETKINTLKSDMDGTKIPEVKNLHEKVMSLLKNPSLFNEKLQTYEKKAFLKTVITDGLIYDKEKEEFDNLKINEIYRLQSQFLPKYSIAA